MQIVEVFKAQNKRLQMMPETKSYSDELLGRLNIVPFGPIPRGELYQRILKWHQDKFIQRVKEEIKCRELSIENEPQVLAFLEDKLYGQGVDIRRVEIYFKSLFTLIDQNKRFWGEISQVKVTFYFIPEERTVKFRIGIFNHLYNGYIDPPELAPYLLPS